MLSRNLLVCLEYCLNANNHALQDKAFRNAIYIHVLIFLSCLKSGMTFFHLLLSKFYPWNLKDLLTVHLSHPVTVLLYWCCFTVFRPWTIKSIMLRNCHDKINGSVYLRQIFFQSSNSLPFLSSLFFHPGLQFGERCNLISGLAAGPRSFIEATIMKKRPLIHTNISLFVADHFWFGVSSQTANTVDFSDAGKRKFWVFFLSHNTV